MGDDEFDDAASKTAESARTAELQERIAVACRGSANPAALSWIAESLEIGPGTLVVDLGAGLGGPSTWFTDRYRCNVIGLEPARHAVMGAYEMFGTTMIQAGAAHVPLRDGCADAALLLGVVSVVARPAAALREAHRIAPRLGLLDYCASGETAKIAGGSRFPTPEQMRAWLLTTGWVIDAEAEIDLPTPPPWQRAISRLAPPDGSDDAAEVRAAIERGEIRPRMVAASR